MKAFASSVAIPLILVTSIVMLPFTISVVASKYFDTVRRPSSKVISFFVIPPILSPSIGTKKENTLLEPVTAPVTTISVSSKSTTDPLSSSIH
ncbi:hypothetical protein R80B4_02320 [Fibrobacteres bacterium R8-0-B4]